MRDQIEKILLSFQRYRKEINEDKVSAAKINTYGEKLEKLESLDFNLEEEDEQKELIDFIIQLEDENNELKFSDVEYIATTLKLGERKKIITLDSYLERYLRQHTMNRTDFLKDHFLLITQIFDKRANDFLETVMKEYGIEDYSFRVEFQLRGLPHIHGVGWLKTILLKNCLDKSGTFIITDDNNDFNEDLIKLIEEWISCSKSTEDDDLNKIVKEVQVHKHTKKSCLKRGDGCCRFGFPRPPSNKTLISRPINEIYPELDEEAQQGLLDDAKKMMADVKNALNELDDDCEEYDNDLERFLDEKCNVQDIDYYHKLLQISVSGKTVILKRKVSERNVNNYNKVFLKHWNGNTDIQLCLDSFAVVTYITDYLTKSDQGLTNALRAALKEKRDADKFRLLNHLKKVYFISTQTCISEATYRLIPGLDLKGSTIKCLFVASGFPNKRKMYFYKIFNEGKTEDDEFDDIEKHFLSMREELEESKEENDGSDVKKSLKKNEYLEPESKHSKYEMRPVDDYCKLFCGTEEKNVFQNMCFAKFSILYEYNSNEPEKALWHIILTEDHNQRKCEVDLEMIQTQIHQKFSKKKTGDEKMVDVIPESEDDSNDEEDSNDEDDNAENSQKPSDLDKMNSSLPSKQLRWGPPKPGIKKPSYEIGYTKRYFTLLKETKTLKQLVKYKDIIHGDLLLPQWIRLSNGRTMKLRAKPYALRIFSHRKDLLEQQYSELLLFTAWRNEKKEFWLDDAEVTEGSKEADEKMETEAVGEKVKLLSCEDPVFSSKLHTLYVQKQTEWQRNREVILPFSNKMKAIKEVMMNDNFERSKTVFDSVNPQAEQQNAEDAENLDISEAEDEFPEEPESEYSTSRKKKQKHNSSLMAEKCIFKKSILPEEKNDLFESVRSLTYEQRVVFDRYIHYFQSIKNIQHGGDLIPEPPRMIVHGNFLYYLFQIFFK